MTSHQPDTNDYQPAQSISSLSGYGRSATGDVTRSVMLYGR